jgi:hypothetical protein
LEPQSLLPLRREKAVMKTTIQNQIRYLTIVKKKSGTSTTPPKRLGKKKLKYLLDKLGIYIFLKVRVLIINKKGVGK